jgi:hypothetical protein
MEMQLQSLAPTCFVSGQPFVEGQRVASFLIRGATEEVVRYDLLETEQAKFAVEGIVACRWVQVFKPRKANENPERDLKLNTETLFLALADPANEPSVENTRLLQFMALMLERKRVLRPKGRTADGQRNIFEHAKTKQLFEIEAGELSPEFFIQVQQQLSVLVGEPKKSTPTAPTTPPPK